jgi:hypothetical protein
LTAVRAMIPERFGRVLMQGHTDGTRDCGSVPAFVRSG